MNNFKVTSAYALMLMSVIFLGSMIGWHELYQTELVSSVNLTKPVSVVSSGEISESRIAAGAIQRKLRCRRQNEQTDIYVILAPPPFLKQSYASGMEMLVYPCSSSRFVTENMLERGHSVVRCGSVGLTKTFLVAVCLTLMGAIILVKCYLRKSGL